MNKIFQISLCSMALLLSTSTVQSKEWSLKDCIHYALTHNISLQKKTLQQEVYKRQPIHLASGRRFEAWSEHILKGLTKTCVSNIRSKV